MEKPKSKINNACAQCEPETMVLLLLLLLLMIWQSPGLPGWQKVNFITVTRRPHHPNIAAGLCCLATSPEFLPTLCEKWSGFFYVHRVFLSYTRDRRLKVSSERLGNEDKAPCPRALLPGRGSNRGPPVWKSEALIARPRMSNRHVYDCSNRRTWQVYRHADWRTWQTELTLFSLLPITHAFRTGMICCASLAGYEVSQQLFWGTCLHLGGLCIASYQRLKSL